MRRGFGTDGTIARGSGESGPKTFWLPGGTDTVVVLLDDLPSEVVRHQMFAKGNRKANGMRCTCYASDPVTQRDPDPRNCLVCNAALQHDRIARKHHLLLTLIDERQFEYEGKVYKDMKRVLELSPDQGDLFARRRKAHGTLLGAVFKVYRSKNPRSARHGDDWTFLGFAYDIQKKEDPTRGLMRRFWGSPAIPNIRRASQERDNKPMSHEDACRELISAYDYHALYGSYDQKQAEAFVAMAEAVFGATPTMAASSSAGGSYAPPPMPGAIGGGSPDYGVPETVPTAAAPTAPVAHAPAAYAPAAQAQAPAQPPAPEAPPWDEPAPPAAAAPSVPQAAPQPPQQPPQQAAPPATPDPSAAYSPPPFPGQVQPPSQQPPAAPAQPTTAQPGAGYDFGGSPPPFPEDPFGTQ